MNQSSQDVRRILRFVDEGDIEAALKFLRKLGALRAAALAVQVSLRLQEKTGSAAARAFSRALNSSVAVTKSTNQLRAKTARTKPVNDPPQKQPSVTFETRVAKHPGKVDCFKCNGRGHLFERGICTFCGGRGWVEQKPSQQAGGPSVAPLVTAVSEKPAKGVVWGECLGCGRREPLGRQTQPSSYVCPQCSRAKRSA